jgi:hypothetical protein
MRVEELERELRAERQEPGPEFARRLDEWAAAGFPRDRGLGPRTAASGVAGALHRARAWLTAVPARRVLAPAGSVAVMLVVIGVAISQSGELGSDDGEGPAPQSVQGMEGDSAGSLDAGSAAEEPAGAAAAPAIGEDSQPLDAGAAELSVPPDGMPADPGGIARATGDRLIDATARLRLGADADEVQETANGVVQVTDRHDGIVLDSQVTTDQAGARAAFELEIPFKELDAALADLSELGDVISRTEEGEDITASAVRARKDLAQTFDRIRAARADLIRADTREERLIIRSRISSLEATANALEARVNGVEREARFATVDVEITSDGPRSEDEDWTLGDALDDAGRVIEVIGGIALISLAVLAPLALVAALIWLLATRALRHQRERALDS